MPATADVDRFLLIVEDDDSFARTLSRSFERRGWRVMRATGLDDMKALLDALPEDDELGHAVVDLKLAGGASGLACVQALHAWDPEVLIVVKIDQKCILVLKTLKEI